MIYFASKLPDDEKMTLKDRKEELEKQIEEYKNKIEELHLEYEKAEDIADGINIQRKIRNIGLLAELSLAELRGIDLALKEFNKAIKEMQDWINYIGKTTLITGETFMEVMLDKFGDFKEKQK